MIDADSTCAVCDVHTAGQSNLCTAHTRQWDKIVADLLAGTEAMQTFNDTFGPHSGAGKGVFAGQLCIAALRLHQTLASKPADPLAANPTALDILQARCPHLEEDVLMALRMVYYCKGRNLVPDGMYDAAEREFIDRPEVDDTPLMNPGSDNQNDYSGRVRALAFYLSLVVAEAGQEDLKKQNALVPIAKPAPEAGNFFQE